MNNILLIDTSSNKEIAVGVKINKKDYIVKRKIGVNKTQIVLSLIDKLLREKGLKVNDINRIEVDGGPGSFTGIRVGTAIANALSFALKIPVRFEK